MHRIAREPRCGAETARPLRISDIGDAILGEGWRGKWDGSDCFARSLFLIKNNGADDAIAVSVSCDRPGHTDGRGAVSLERVVSARKNRSGNAGSSDVESDAVVDDARG